MASNVQARLRACGASRGVFYFLLIAVLAFALPTSGRAAEYAALVMDARNGEVLHSRNADTRLHPASLTKMMTLYVAFEAIENGEISLDTNVTISRHAASEPPSKLGLRSGQKIKLRYLIRAAAVKSANDAATAIGEAIEGSEAAFARRMNRTAKAMGMSRTTFKNAHGLTASGHLSTARDMSKLGRHIFYDYPDYYNLFSRKTVDAGVRTVAHTNSRFLNSYSGADGIKTGYTSAAGFNLTASARRGNERIITTVFGGRSTASRNARVTELMDLGFKRAGSRVATHKPKRPRYLGKGTTAVAEKSTAQKSRNVRVALKASPIPSQRPLRALAPEKEDRLLTVSADILNVITESTQTTQVAPKALPAKEINKLATQALATAPQKPVKTAAVITLPAGMSNHAPASRPQRLQLAQVEQTAAVIAPTSIIDAKPEIVTRISSSGSRHWGINVGTYGSEYEARKVLLKVALAELETLDGALRKVVRGNRGYRANFHGLTEGVAALTCRKLEARGNSCSTFGPS